MDCFVGDVIDYGLIRKECLNLIVSSCGTGKSYFCANKIFEIRTDVKPEEVMFVTSRSLAVDQQVHDYDSLVKYESDDPICDFWCGNASIENYSLGTPFESSNGKIRAMTYDKILNLLFGKQDDTFVCNALLNVKIIIFDEIHSLYCDPFIGRMVALQMWLHYEVNKGDRLFFGLTATPGILLDQIDNLGVCLNVINEPLQRYKARKLWCIDTQNLLKLIENDFDGKTIIMCRSVVSCYSLQKLIPHSAVLAGRSGNDYVPCDMDTIRNTIIKESKLPDDVRVLISTSTAREGFTFREQSEIKNVVLFFHDEMNIHQFMGRCRYDIENLVVVDFNRDGSKIKYFAEQDEQFRRFCETRGEDSEWFGLVEDIIEQGVSETCFLLSDQEKKIKKVPKPKDINPSISIFRTRDSLNYLRDYISSQWLTDNKCQKMIYGQEIKKNILEDVAKLNVFSDDVPDISWKKFEHVIKDLGFEIRDGRTYVGRTRVRYKVITKETGE